MGKYSMLRTGDRVLVCFSGGTCSRVLLECVRQVVVPTGRLERGKTSCEVEVLYIDEGRHGQEHELLNQHKLLTIVESFGWRLNIVKLEETRRGTEGARAPESLEHSELMQHLWQHLEACDDLSIRQDIRAYLRRQLITQIATARSCTKVLLGTCASRLATVALADMVKGRGFSMPADIQYVDRREISGSPQNSGPVVLQPMRDTVLKDLTLLCRHEKWDTLTPSLPLMKEAVHMQSLNSLTAQFVAQLQDDLPSSVHTILRTVGKLQPFQFNEPELKRTSMSRKAKIPLQGSEHDGHVYPLCSVCRAPTQEDSGRDLRPIDVNHDKQIAEGSHPVWLCWSCRQYIL